jgi:dTMP kinase
MSHAADHGDAGDTAGDVRAAGGFLVLEGIDGAGKSSQVAPLADWLRSLGREVVTCRDPGATPTGDAIRAILLDRRDLRLDAIAEMLLYMAARAQLVSEVIRPALARGAWVLSDRYLLANVVYQGHAGGIDPDVVRRVGDVATGGLGPDLVLLLDIDLATAARRMNRPLDRLESRGDEYRGRLRAGYRAEADREPGRIVVVDATRGPDAVQESLRDAILARWPELRTAAAARWDA